MKVIEPTCRRCKSRMKQDTRYGFFMSYAGRVVHASSLYDAHWKTLCGVEMYGWKQVGTSDA